MAGLTDEEIDEVAGGIEHEGLGYWVQNYGYKGDNDPELKKLCQNARKAMDELENYLQDNELMY